VRTAKTGLGFAGGAFILVGVVLVRVDETRRSALTG
jgi:hypothetical protein